ncbi:MAG: hypothetical protein ACJ71Y_19880 [Blastococcus sp.]
MTRGATRGGGDGDEGLPAWAAVIGVSQVIDVAGVVVRDLSGLVWAPIAAGLLGAALLLAAWRMATGAGS